MFAVQDDWIQYEGVPARRSVVRGGATCAQRIPVVSSAPRPRLLAVAADPAAVVRPARRRPLRLTRRGRVVLVVLPLIALSGALAAASVFSGTTAVPAGGSTTVVVGSEDALRSTAERPGPSADPRRTVVQLRRATGPRDAQVPAGTVLRLPAQP